MAGNIILWKPAIQEEADYLEENVSFKRKLGREIEMVLQSPVEAANAASQVVNLRFSAKNSIELP